MKNLFLVDGASGAGKSDLLRWAVGNTSHDVSYLPKATTRKRRQYEKGAHENQLDLEFLTANEFSARRFDYTYVYGNERYGFSSESLMRLIEKHDNVIAIIRSTSLMRRIMKEFSFINVVPMFIYTDIVQLTERLRRSGCTDKEIEFRVSRSEIVAKDYRTHPEFYREIIINDPSIDNFHSTIERVMDKHFSARKIDPNAIPVMMSYNQNNPKLGDYFEAMESAVKQIASSFHCVRLDMVTGTRKISSEFTSVVSRSRCVIVDLTENKPDVLYELGFLHGRKIPCIITAEKGTRATFYPSEYKILYYSSVRELRERLYKELSDLLTIKKALRSAAA